MLKRSTALLRLLYLPFIFLSLGSSGTDELIGKVEKHYNGARTLSVNFVESYELAGHPRPPEAGVLSIKKQGKMRWDYSRPQGKLFISDGKNVFLYTSRDNRVEKVPLKSTEDMRAPLAFLLGHLDLKKDFRDFRVTQGENGLVWLSAVAKSERTPYSQVQMLIGDTGEIRRLKVFGRDESTVEYGFTDEKVNPALPDSLFHFAVPEGAQVVESADMEAR